MATNKELIKLSKAIGIAEDASKGFRREAVELESANDEASKAVHDIADKFDRLIEAAKVAEAESKRDL
jgi:predicted Ser/Thr protein kinase